MINTVVFRGLLLVVIAVVVSACFSGLKKDLEQIDKVNHEFSGTVSVEGFDAESVSCSHCMINKAVRLRHFAWSSS